MTFHTYGIGVTSFYNDIYGGPTSNWCVLWCKQYQEKKGLPRHAKQTDSFLCSRFLRSWLKTKIYHLKIIDRHCAQIKIAPIMSIGQDYYWSNVRAHHLHRCTKWSLKWSKAINKARWRNERSLTQVHCHESYFVWNNISLITRFEGPTWGPSGAGRTQVGPMSAPWTLLSGSPQNGPSFSRRHSQMHFREGKCTNFYQGFTEVCSQESNYKYSSIGSGNGLALIAFCFVMRPH